MNIVLVINENNEGEWVKMNKEGTWFIVYHYVNNELKRRCRYDDFFEAIEAFKEWQSYFSQG